MSSDHDSRHLSHDLSGYRASPHPRDRPIVYTLIVLAVLTGTATLLAVATNLILILTRPDLSGPLQLLVVVAPAIVGIAGLGGLLAAILVTIRVGRIAERMAFIEQQSAIIAEHSVTTGHEPLPTGSPALDPAEVYRLLVEIRETLLLPEPERHRRFNAMVAAEFDKRLKQAAIFASSRDFHHAREQLATLTERFGEDERIRELRTKIENDAKVAEESDVAQARLQIADLMTASRWDEAERMARNLADKYPASKDPVGMIEHVCRERQMHEQKRRQRLHADIQELVHQRRWQDAMIATRQFLALFPIGVDANALRQQLDTLEANAEIQTRQELEVQIKEHLRQHQYWEALAIARQMIADYPFSPQANVLRNQLPRLEELANTQQPKR